MEKRICEYKEDIQDILEMTINPKQSPLERTVTFMGQVQDTSRFRIGDTVVEMGWKETDVTLQNALHALLRANCQ